MSSWDQLTAEQKIAHKSEVEAAAVAMHAAEAAANDARKYLTPGFPETWREDSSLVAARAADAAYKSAFERHSALLYQFAE